MSLFRRLKNIARSQINHNSQQDSSDPTNFSHHHQEEPHPSTALSQEEAYYANLEIPAGSSFEDIKNAYRSLMKKYHPDLHNSDPEKKALAEQLTQGLNEAWEYFKTREKTKP